MSLMRLQVCFVRLMVGRSPVQRIAGVRFPYEAPILGRMAERSKALGC